VGASGATARTVTASMPFDMEPHRLQSRLHPLLWGNPNSVSRDAPNEAHGLGISCTMFAPTMRELGQLDKKVEFVRVEEHPFTFRTSVRWG
jgi:hypothetical protein